MRARRLSAPLALGVVCSALGCHPDDANIGGAFSCPATNAACFFFDSGLQLQAAGDAGPAQSEEATLSLFDVPEDPNPENAPRIAYPLDDSTEPSNIYDLDIQWHRASSAQTLFRIRVESPELPYSRYDLYTQCFPKNDGCHYSVPESAWFDNVTSQLRGAGAALTVAASDGLGGPIAVSAPIQLRFTYAPVPGGLYYWSAHPPGAAPDAMDEGTTYRLAFGARRAAPFIRPGIENPNTCEGCHAVSGNGNVIAFTATNDIDGPGSGSFIARLTNAPSVPLAPAPTPSDSAMIALNKDGSLALVGKDNQLYLETVGTGVQTQIEPALLGDEKQGYFPDFSPDGLHIVVTLSDHPDKPWAVSTGSIATLDFDAATSTFSAAKVLVPMTDQELHFYPSWSPDSQWIVFASAPRGPDPTRCTDPNDPNNCSPGLSYDQPNARLRLAHFPDGRVYDLARATQGVGLTSTLPKFAPLPTDGHNQLFITFNSKMPYGVEVPDNIPAQLWLSVLDFDRLPDDPSSAPVWLPFQSFGQKNHMAYWTNQVPCRKDQVTDQGCGPDEHCLTSGPDEGQCQPNGVVK